MSRSNIKVELETLGQDEGIGENAGPKDGRIANGQVFKQAEEGVLPCDEKVQVPTE